MEQGLARPAPGAPSFQSASLEQQQQQQGHQQASLPCLQLHTQHARVPLLFPPSLPSTSPSLSLLFTTTHHRLLPPMLLPSQ
jgi:hypothetical protein